MNNKKRIIILVNSTQLDKAKQLANDVSKNQPQFEIEILEDTTENRAYVNSLEEYTAIDTVSQDTLLKAELETLGKEYQKMVDKQLDKQNDLYSRPLVKNTIPFYTKFTSKKSRKH